MTKHKKATSAASRSTRGGRLSGPPRTSGTARTPTPKAAGEPPATYALAAECMVCDAAFLKEQLAVFLEEPLAVTLDITALQRIDTAGLQVITTFVRERTGHSRPVIWQGTSPVLTAAAQLLGLATLLGLPA